MTTRTQPLLVRIDPETRTALKNIATTSDRTISHLVRQATLTWITDPHRSRPVTETGTSNDEFVNVRFAAHDMAAIRDVAEQMDLDRGAVIRDAVRAWLAAGDSTTPDKPRLIAPVAV